MKKKLALAVTILLVLVSIAGCGSTPATEVETSSPENTEAAGSTEPQTIDTAYLTGVLSKSAASEGISYDMTISGAGQNSTMTYAMEGSKIKTSGSFQGVETVSIMDGTSVINYDPISKTGMKFAIDQTTPQTQGLVDPNLADSITETSMTFVEKGEFDGAECLIVSAKNAAQTGDVKLWINEKLGMVVKMEATTAEGQIFTTELTNVVLGKLPAGTFDVPTDIKIVELPAM